VGLAYWELVVYGNNSTFCGISLSMDGGPGKKDRNEKEISYYITYITYYIQ